MSGFSEAVIRKFVFPYDDAVLWSIAAFREAQRWSLKVPFAAIISTFPPINTHLAAVRLKRYLRVPWIADFRDPLWLKDVRDHPGLPRLVDRALERHFVRSADALVTVTDVLQNNWKRRYPSDSAKFHLLWNGYDPAEPLNPRPPAGNGKRILAHVGALYYGRRPTALFQSLARLIQSGRVDPASVRAEFTGTMDPSIRDAQSEVFVYLEEKGALQLKPPVSRQEALTRIEQADYLLLLDMAAGASSFTVPAKIFEYIRVGRPILTFTEPGSPVERILGQSGILHTNLYKSDSDDTVDQKLLEFLRLPSDPKPPSEWFLNEFDGRRQAGKIAQLLDEMLHRSGGLAMSCENSVTC